MFKDRVQAGRLLAAKLEHLRGQPVVVLGLPRGGVPVAYQVALALDAPLDIVVVRKLGVPSQPELAIGAIGEDGARVVNEELVRLTGVTEAELGSIETRERRELDRRVDLLRRNRPRRSLQGMTAVIVDDGIATGSTARAACLVARAHGAGRVVLATPVAPPDWIATLGAAADHYVCVATPPSFAAVGQFYDIFTQVSDDEVVRLLDLAAVGHAMAAGDDEVELTVGDLHLHGNLTVPGATDRLVVFAHGSGSSRHSPRNRAVARVLNQAGLATLLFDLLSHEEELSRMNVFDVELLARRLSSVTTWVRQQPGFERTSIGLFGASTGAAAALWAATEPDARIDAIVSRGGRPDLASPRLPYVLAPTLLVVGSRDEATLDLNRQAQAQLTCEHQLLVIPGASHLFEEHGTLFAAADAACDWFGRYLGPGPRATV